MTDDRFKKLAHNLINYSCNLKENEKVLIEGIGDCLPLIKELVKEAYKANAIPFVTLKNKEVDRELMLNCNEKQLNLMAKYEALRMSDMDAYIGIRAFNNSAETSDVPSDKMSLFNKLFQEPVHGKIRVPKTKWVILRYPNSSMAQSANMSTEAFENYYFKVCNLDYSKMSMAMDNLVDLMNKTDKVRIIAKDTDISFSIKDIPAIKCSGEMNIPDGEVYTAPVKNSVNGTITYNAPSIYQGFTFENVSLTFKDGKIIKATSNNTEKINEIFDMDEGARYIGEFALGVNPYINEPMKDILFDEKITGSIHFTPGSCYDDADNSNKSAVHWDLVQIQRPEYGGGEIYFDDVLIRKDGIFVIDSLKCLNPENLI